MATREPSPVHGVEERIHRRIGLELEYPVVDAATGLGMTRATAERLWLTFAERSRSWSPYREVLTGAVTGVRRVTAGFPERVDTDTGICTVEVSLAPQDSIGAAVDAASAVVADLHRSLEALGHTMLCTGMQPVTWCDPARKTQKDWYLLLAPRWRFHHWFVPSASHQVSVDVTASEAVRAVNVLCAFAGVFAALTASSPIARGRVQQWKEMRNWIWHERRQRISLAEAAYTSNWMPAAPFADTGAYIDYCWDSTLFFITDLKSSGYALRGRPSFREFLMSDRAMSGRRPDRQIVEVEAERGMLDRIHQYGWLAAKLHYGFASGVQLDDVRAALAGDGIGELFEAHAVNCYVENRTCGVAPLGEEGVGAALTLGVLERLADAEALLAALSWARWRQLWIDASRTGLSGHGGAILEIMQTLVGLARQGLRDRGMGEERYLDPVDDRLARLETPADRMMLTFADGGLRRFIETYRRHC
jgi:gamma-glutamylcysteine synthetase